MFHITCVGGDLRQLYLAQILVRAGHHVRILGISRRTCQAVVGKEFDKIHCNQIEFFSCAQAAEAIAGSELILGPIPLTKDGVTIHSSEPDFSLTLDELLRCLTPSQYLIAGMIPQVTRERLRSRSINCYDYLKNDSFARLNAIATAEGAIGYAISHSTGNLHLSRALVLGYGTCGRVLANKLKALDAQVTVTGRREETKALATSNGFAYQDLSQLGTCHILQDFDYIFNTIPKLVLTAPLLSKFSPGCTIVDIASAPGGLDYNYVTAHSLNAFLYLGIPGKIAPRASAQILYDIILNRLKERSPLYVPQPYELSGR